MTNPTAIEALATASDAEVPATVDIDYKGLAFTIPVSAQWPYETLEAFEDGKLASFIRALLGPEQHAAFKATKPKVVDVTDLVQAIQKGLGISGN